jgi:hypothetical protein
MIRGSMLGKGLLPTDEELGKKDDDHKPGVHGRSPAWNWRKPKTPLRWRRRRLLLAAMGIVFMYMLFSNMPDLSDLGPSSTDSASAQVYDVEPRGPPPMFNPPRDGSIPAREYNGLVRFYRLAASLNKASHTDGYYPSNRNVLFAVSSLGSASTLIPMMCEMAKWNRNYVHGAFMGREDIPLPVLLEINGVDKETCPVMWHDARPDYMEYSSEARAESSVAAALTHIQSYLHPQVAIIDDSVSEDAFFVRGIRAKAKTLGIPVIEIPKDCWQNFMWMTRLDAGSLRSWHKPNVDILIQVPSGSTGGALRLLNSLKAADYSGLKPPRLIIELGASVDNSMLQAIQTFSWPESMGSPLETGQVTIRRHIAEQHRTQEDSVIKLLEAFYPSSPADSHLLLLAPNAEVSPLYYHYLKYALLEYRYSSYGSADDLFCFGDEDEQDWEEDAETTAEAVADGYVEESAALGPTSAASQATITAAATVGQI